MSTPASQDRTGRLETGAGLWWPKALFLAFINRTLDFYPRLTAGDKVASKPSDDIVQELVDAMGDWDTLEEDDVSLAAAIELAKASLDEVKEQTEYQDQKATRLLTVTTFLSALSAGLYAGFSSAYPLSAVWTRGNIAGWLMVVAYISFLAFVLAALGGMLITFHATRTRFKYPATATATKESGPTRSFLFYREMIGVTPAGWARSFVDRSADGKLALNPSLKIAYLKNYVGEAYLVAAKTADKLRYLQPAQSLLAWALRCLAIFIALIVVVSANWPPAPTKPAAIRTVPGAPIEVRLGGECG